MCATISGMDQLHGDTQAIAAAAHTAFEQMSHSERIRDPTNILFLAPERRRLMCAPITFRPEI